MAVSRRERQGVAAMRALAPVMHAMLDTRNATRAKLGNHEGRAAYTAASQRTDVALSALEQRLQTRQGPLALAERVAALRKAWAANAQTEAGVDTQGRTVFGPVSTAAQTVLRAIAD